MATKKPIKKQPQKLLSNRREKRILLIISVVLFLIVGITIIWFANASVSPTKTYVAKITDLGFLTFSTPNTGRDGGNSALVGGKVLWGFGDTFYAPKVTKFTGDLFRSATAALGNTSNPTQLAELVDTQGAPYQFIPYTPEQLAYNTAANKGNDRYAMWPSSIVTRPGGNSAFVYFFTLLIQPGEWKNQGVGIATAEANNTVAQRQTNVLFSPSEPSFRKALVVGEIVYVYAECASKLCPVARAPLAQATSRLAYQFWNGTTWVSDVGQAKAVIPSSNLGTTIMYNRSLKTYVSANIQNYSHGIYFSYAAAPEGPWTTPIRAIDLPADKQEYAPNFHQELSSDNDRSVFISYTLAGLGGGIKLLKVALDPPVDGIPPTNLVGSKSTVTTTNNGTSKGSIASNSTAQKSASDDTVTNTENGNTVTPAIPGATADKVPGASEKSWWQKVLDFFSQLFNGGS